jgi:(hydroxyamino)benzene mutase
MQMFISCDLGNDYETQSCYAIIRQIAASNRKPRSQLFTSFPRSRPPSDKTAKAKHHLNVSTKQTVMNSLLSRQGQRLLQIGILLIIYSSFDGFVIPYLASPRIGLSVHTLSALQGVLLLAQGLLWPKLNLVPTASRIAFGCSLYGTFAILAAYTISAAWGVGNETIILMGELPHGLHHGTVFQEMFIKILAYSSAPTGLTAFFLILWGLRAADARSLHD